MANFTVEDIVDRSFGRLADISAEYPSTRGFLYERVGFRQRELFSRAAGINPERFGTCATANLSSGNADLSDMEATVPAPELIQRVEISDIGTSPYVVGQKVNIVAADDQSAAFAPRAMIRDQVLIGVGEWDLALVTAIKVYYARLPALILLTAPTTVIEFEAPWNTLLELDLVILLLEKALKISADVRAQAIQSFKAEESRLVESFDRNVREYATATSRFIAPLAVASKAG